MHLTTLNSKSEPEPELAAEFGRVFAKESPTALEWSFRVWRDRSPFFPAVSDILALVKEWRRGEQERKELHDKLDQKFLLEEGRRQGQVPELAEVFQNLRAVAARSMDIEPMKREQRYREKIASAQIASPPVTLSQEQIVARRDKEREEIEEYEKREKRHWDGLESQS